MTISIAALPGDGIGPEIMEAGLLVLDRLASHAGLDIQVTQLFFGGAAVDATGMPFPAETEAACRTADAVLLGAVGGPKWDGEPAERRPEKGLLALRAALGTFANLRPVKVIDALASKSVFRPGHLDGVDILVVRELTGGIYFGTKERSENSALDVCSYSAAEIERIVRVAGKAAQGRRGKVTSVDKANVLETSRLWREVTTRVMAAEFPDVTLDHILVDAAAMKLISDPAGFDVIVTENMFGDILTDEASMLAGSIGILPSASLSADGPGIFEPIHGSAPDIAGTGKANPLGMLASVAMMLDHALGQGALAQRLNEAISASVAAGQVTADLGGTLTTEAATEAVLERL